LYGGEFEDDSLDKDDSEGDDEKLKCLLQRGNPICDGSYALGLGSDAVMENAGDNCVTNCSPEHENHA